MLTLATMAMRTRFEVAIADRGDTARLRAAAEEALEEVARVEGRLSAYRPDSTLFAVNARAHVQPVLVDALTMALLVRASALSDATGGAFDMTVGPLLGLWGLKGDAAGRVPTDEEVRAALTLVGMGRVVRLNQDERTVAFSVSGVRLDPGAIGKGYALERARELLRDAGVRNALLHGGTSTVCATGDGPDSVRGWPIALQHPTDLDAYLTRVRLRDGDALSVSAVHGKTFWAEGRRFGHVLDPRSGRPVESDTLLAAAVTPDAAESDALSTALLVLGTAGLEHLAHTFPGAGLLVAKAEAAGAVETVTAGDWPGDG